MKCWQAIGCLCWGGTFWLVTLLQRREANVPGKLGSFRKSPLLETVRRVRATRKFSRTAAEGLCAPALKVKGVSRTEPCKKLIWFD